MNGECWIKSLYLKERSWSKGEVGETAHQRLRYWTRLFGNEKERFAESLRGLSSVDPQSLAFLAESGGVPSRESLEQEWVSWFNELLSGTYDNFPLPSEDEIWKRETAPPFSGFFKPFWRLGLGKLRERSSLFQELREETVRHALIQLTHLLFQISHRTLILELNVARVSGILKGDTSEERFRYFSESLLGDREYVRRLYEEYPVLIRLLLNKTLRWVDFFSEVLERTEADRPLLSKCFLDGEDPGSLLEIRMGLGDSHNKGKGVCLVRFESGLQVVYKPRPLGIDARFQDLLRWLNGQFSESEPFYVMKVLDRGVYGWVEFVDHRSCQTEDELSRFYARIGRQLALLYGMEAVDFHYENLIAHGEFPVLIDLESLFHQSLTKRSYTEKAVDRAAELLQRSVQSTGIVPAPLYYRNDPKSLGLEVSGLGGKEQKTPFKVPTIAQKNTDQMQIVQDYARLKDTENRPRLDGKDVDVSDYLDDLERGFRDMYNWLMEHKEQFKKQLHRFAEVEVRSIMRPTIYYGELLRQSWHPDFLRDGLDRDILLHRLWLDTSLRPGLKKVVQSEKRDLLEGDIPYFFTLPGQTHLWDSEGNCLKDCFEESALEKVYRKIDLLNPRDLQEQLQVLHMSILANDARHYADVAPIIPRLEHDLHGMEREEFLREAERIGAYLLSKAITGKDGEEDDLSWISTILEGNNEILWQIAPVGDDLYNGNSGIALFFGYLALLTGQERFEEAARKAMVSVRKKLREFRDHPTWSIGAFSGAGGYLYAMDHLAHLWGDQAMTEELLDSLPGFINMIPNDRLFDFIGGAAGSLSILLGIYRRTGSIRALEGAKRCAEHLLNHAEFAGDGIGWRLPWEEQPLTGFSHGTAGIAAVLAQMYSITGDSRFLDAVQQALAYERSFFVPTAGNWRTPGRDNLSVAWCHGAPGILLGRLMLKQIGYEDEWLDREINIALRTLLKEGFGNNRSLCHGDFGHMEILRFAAKVLKDDRCDRWADSAARQVLGHLKRKGFHTGVSRGVEAAGLMFGLAGFGFGFLKQYSPYDVPSVLRLADTQSLGTIP